MFVPEPNKHTGMKTVTNLQRSVQLAVIMLLAAAGSVYAQSVSDTTAQFCKVSMNNGTTVTGMLVQQDSANVVINNSGLGQLTILRSNIESVEVVTDGHPYTFTLSSGKTYRGTVVRHDDRAITIRTTSGEVQLMTGNIADFKSTAANVAVAFDHGSRYLFAPSSIPLRQGEGYYQNIMILMNGFQYGVTDRFSVGAGIIMPIGFFGTMKYGLQVGKNMHVAAGGMFITTMLGLEFGVGCGFGSFTYGNRNTNATVTLGYGALLDGGDWEVTRRPIINFSAMVKLADGFSLVTENYFIPVRDDRAYMNPSDPVNTYSYHPQFTGGFRVGGGRHTFDIAGATIGEINRGMFVIPYFSYAYHFQRGTN
jgi:hypothetical protein